MRWAMPSGGGCGGVWASYRCTRDHCHHCGGDRTCNRCLRGRVPRVRVALLHRLGFVRPSFNANFVADISHRIAKFKLVRCHTTEKSFDQAADLLLTRLQHLGDDPLQIGSDPLFQMGFGRSINSGAVAAAVLVADDRPATLVLFENFRVENPDYAADYRTWRRTFLKMFIIEVRRAAGAYQNDEVRQLADAALAAYNNEL